MTRAVLGVAARHGVVELRGSSSEQDVKDEDAARLEACVVCSLVEYIHTRRTHTALTQSGRAYILFHILTCAPRH